MSVAVLTKAHYRPNVATSLVRAMRPYQWVKNLTCFAGLIFSGRLFQQEMVIHAGSAFVAFSLVASAIYLLNDYIDRHRDRLNPRTADRPIASGALPLAVAAVAFAGLVVAAGLIASVLGRACLVVMTGYATMNVGYSLRLKRTVIADVMCIAVGFVLRVLFGVYAVQVLPSPWILLCMFSLAMFLGFGKRKGELNDLGEGAVAARGVLKKYTTPFVDMVIGITATITILTYMLFTVSSRHDPTLVITVVPVVYCVLRYAHQVMFERLGQSPEALFVRDKMMWIVVGTWLVMCGLILYGGLRLVEIPRP
jgi:4-hydroxybenzoate polyprenyltransferase